MYNNMYTCFSMRTKHVKFRIHDFISSGSNGKTKSLCCGLYIQGVTRHRDPNRAVSGRVRQVVFIYRFNNMEKI